ncbi:MAG: transcriptional regulator [Segetibacter sp.]|nr:transcriptional regulator [Segetibacter sp.]
MNGTAADLTTENIQDKTLINQFNRISELSEVNKTVVSKLIDTFLFQQEMRKNSPIKKYFTGTYQSPLLLIMYIINSAINSFFTV